MNDDDLERRLIASLLKDDPGAMPEALRRRVSRIPVEAHRPNTLDRLRGWVPSVAALGGVAALGVVLLLVLSQRAPTTGWPGGPPIGGVGASESPSAGIQASAEPTPAPSSQANLPAGTPPCLIADLGVTAQLGSAMAGAIVGNIEVTNDGPNVCVLTGPPTISVRAGAQPLSVTFHALDEPAPGTESFASRGPVELKPTERADAWIAWENWCGPTLPGPSLAVGLGSAGSAGTKQVESGYPRCNDSTAGSSLTAWRFASEASLHQS